MKKILAIFAVLFISSMASSYALLQQAGTISVSTAPGQKTVFLWLVQSDEEKPITILLSAEGQGSEFLNFTKSIEMGPKQTIQIPIDLAIPPDYSGPFTLSPTLVATQLGSMGGPTVINLQMAKTVIIYVDTGSAQPLNDSPVQTIEQQEPSQVQGSVKIIPKDTAKSGGCLIATAAYGSELAPQVQMLREIRDNVLFDTGSGTAFMITFDEFYYTFSPGIADLERQNPVFKEAVKVTITPMLSTLSVLNYVDIDSEQEMLGYGIGIILLNAGMYLAVPAIIIYKIRNSDRPKFLP